MKYKAFTFLEIVVVMGILVAVALISLPLTYATVVQSNAEAFMREVNSGFFYQQQQASSGSGGEDYGIAFEDDSVILFTGNSLASATDSQEVEFPSGLALDSIALTNDATEIVFASQQFRPDESGYIDFTDTSFRHRLQINTEGLIEYIKVEL